MIFHSGDIVLARGKISDEGISDIDCIVPYPADIPLPNQEVWVRDEDNEEWMKGIYLYYNDKQDTNYPHVVWRDEGFTYEQKQVTTKNPHREYEYKLRENIKTIKKELLITERELSKIRGAGVK